MEAYKDATREPYSYLLLDLRPEQHEDLRLRTNVFPGETHYVYVPKNERANETVSADAEKNTQNGREGEARVCERCNTQFIDCVSECAKNVLKGNVPLTDEHVEAEETGSTCAVRQEDVANEEAQNYPERRLSLGTSCTRTVCTGRSAAKVMQQAKKLVLFDEFDREYLQRTADAVAKTGRSLELSDTLRSFGGIRNLMRYSGRSKREVKMFLSGRDA